MAYITVAFSGLNYKALSETCCRGWNISAAKTGNLPLLFLYIDSCLRDACPSLRGPRCLELYYTTRGFQEEKGTYVVWQTDGRFWVCARAGEGHPDKCIKNGSVPSCCSMWCGSPGVTVTLAGTKKTWVPWGRELRMTGFGEKSSQDWAWHFWMVAGSLYNVKVSLPWAPAFPAMGQSLSRAQRNPQKSRIILRTFPVTLQNIEQLS